MKEITKFHRNGKLPNPILEHIVSFSAVFYIRKTDTEYSYKHFLQKFRLQHLEFVSNFPPHAQK